MQLLGPSAPRGRRRIYRRGIPGVQRITRTQQIFPFFFFFFLQAKDVYEIDTISVDKDDKITIPQLKPIPSSNGRRRKRPDWPGCSCETHAVIEKNSDSEIVDDMPNRLKLKWQNYRQALLIGPQQ